jgi:hypothetical protein
MISPEHVCQSSVQVARKCSALSGRKRVGLLVELVNRTIDGEPKLDQIPKALVADFGVSLKVVDNLPRKKPLVLVLKSLW